MERWKDFEIFFKEDEQEEVVTEKFSKCRVKCKETNRRLQGLQGTETGVS